MSFEVEMTVRAYANEPLENDPFIFMYEDIK